MHSPEISFVVRYSEISLPVLALSVVVFNRFFFLGAPRRKGYRPILDAAKSLGVDAGRPAGCCRGGGGGDGGGGCPCFDSKVISALMASKALI